MRDGTLRAVTDLGSWKNNANLQSILMMFLLKLQVSRRLACTSTHYQRAETANYETAIRR